MPLVLEREQQLTTTKPNPTPVLHVHMYEAAALCPKCKAFQTVNFVDGRLVETRKFSQRDGKVYHDCGSIEPCRVYRGI
jgi:hypothetical protein